MPPKDAAARDAGKLPFCQGRTGCALLTDSPRVIIPVTITVRMPVFLRVWITGVVCGFRRFLMTSSPRRLRSRSTVSLEG